MKVAVVGATGLVGTKMLQVLAERNFPVTELIPVASERSVGKEVEFRGKKYKVVSMIGRDSSETGSSYILSRRRHIIRMGAEICGKQE